jgi:hypothetical protein
MWIASNLGYFSIVKKDDGYYVRARSVDDLDYLKAAAGLDNEILQWPGTDYLARIIVDKPGLEKIQKALFDSITYDNFKDSIAANPRQSDKLKYYGHVWGIMWEYQMKVEDLPE